MEAFPILIPSRGIHITSQGWEPRLQSLRCPSTHRYLLLVPTTLHLGPKYPTRYPTRVAWCQGTRLSTGALATSTPQPPLTTTNITSRLTQGTPD